MKRISSRATFFNKRIFPLLWFGMLALIVLGPMRSGGAKEDPAFLVFPVLMAGVAFIFFRRVLWDLMDEVYDCGNFLLVRKAGEEDSIPLANIMNVSVSNFQNPPRITLRLIRPCRFGNDVAFLPIKSFTFNPFAKSQIGEDLIKRVYEVRSASLT